MKVVSMIKGLIKIFLEISPFIVAQDNPIVELNVKEEFSPTGLKDFAKKHGYKLKQMDDQFVIEDGLIVNVEDRWITISTRKEKMVYVKEKPDLTDLVELLLLSTPLIIDTTGYDYNVYGNIHYAKFMDFVIYGEFDIDEFADELKEHGLTSVTIKKSGDAYIIRNGFIVFYIRPVIIKNHEFIRITGTIQLTKQIHDVVKVSQELVKYLLEVYKKYGWDVKL